MKAARLYGSNDLRIEEVEVNSLKPTDIKVKVMAAGICGSDVNLVSHPETYVESLEAPLTPGHEFSGEVVEVGKEVKNIKVGDRVCAEPFLTEDGFIGNYHLNPNNGFIGVGDVGAFSEYLVFPEQNAHILPDDIDFEQGAMVEPAAVAFHSVRLGEFKVGNRAAVFGAGPIGLFTIETLKAAGAGEIYVSEPSQIRRKLAADLGAIAIDPNEVNPEEFIKEKTNGEGVDTAFEVSGVGPVFNQALNSIKPSGTLVVTSTWTELPTIDANNLYSTEKRIIGSFCYNNEFGKVIQLMQQGYFSKDTFVTKRINLDDLLEQGIKALQSGEEHVKILVDPQQ